MTPIQWGVGGCRVRGRLDGLRGRSMVELVDVRGSLHWSIGSSLVPAACPTCTHSGRSTQQHAPLPDLLGSAWRETNVRTCARMLGSWLGIGMIYCVFWPSNRRRVSIKHISSQRGIPPCERVSVLRNSCDRNWNWSLFAALPRPTKEVRPPCPCNRQAANRSLAGSGGCGSDWDAGMTNGDSPQAACGA